MKSVPPRGSGWVRRLSICDCRLPIGSIRQTPIQSRKSTTGNRQSTIPFPVRDRNIKLLYAYWGLREFQLWIPVWIVFLTIDQGFSLTAVTGVESLISHSGRALLWLLCIGVLVVFLRGGWRVARRRLV